MNGLTPKQETFLDQVRRAMENYFGPDSRRINHALRVTEFAGELLGEIEADAVLTLAPDPSRKRRDPPWPEPSSKSCKPSRR